MRTSFKGYVCGYWSLDTHLSPSREIKEIYKTQKALKEEQNCWPACGIVEVEIRMKKVIRKRQESKG